MAYQQKNILVVEDEPTLATILCEYLAQAGFAASTIDDGALVIDAVKRNMPDLIILDLMLPHRDGLDIYREIRTFSQVPIMMATAKVEEIDRLLGLELGADDYICKPYSTREVVARVKNILRRNASATNTEPQKEALHIDVLSMKVSYHQQPVSLTPAEFKLLAFLFDNQGRIYSRDQLMNHIYPDHRIVTDRTIDSHIKNLRRKMSEVHPEADCIKSVYGMGYKFEE
jgi:two-component system, OmpR family, response regulator BaeR